MAIKILKLTSVEDIIGDYEEKDGECIINKPAKIIMFPSENSGMGMAIMPWVPFAKDEVVSIKKECIMVIMEPADDMKNEYSQRFGSGVITPSKSLIVWFNMLIQRTLIQRIIRFFKLYLWQRWRIPRGDYCYKVIKTKKNPPAIYIKNCPYWDYREDWPVQACGYCHFLKRGDIDINLDKTIVLTEVKTGEEYKPSEMPFGIGLLWDQCKECGIRVD